MIKKRLGIRTIMLLLLLLLLIGVISWRILNAGQQVEKKMQPLAVTTAVAKTMEKRDLRNLTGTVEGLETAVISSRFAGKVDRILVEDGQAVTAGSTLFIMDRVELENASRVAQNTLRQANANLHTAQTDYQRYYQLYAQNAVTKQQLDTAEARMITSQTEADTAYANLNTAQKQIADGAIVSPLTGVVANKAVTTGQIVSPGVTLLTVEQIDDVYVVVHVEQKDISLAKMGTPVSIRVDTYPEQTFDGQVAVISPVAGNESRMFRVKVRVNNSGQLLKPGMFAEAELSSEKLENVLAVPRTAVMGSKGLQYVYVVENGQAKKMLVEAGILLGDQIEIKTGISVGMRVITDNLDKIKDGDLLLCEGGEET